MLLTIDRYVHKCEHKFDTYIGVPIVRQTGHNKRIKNHKIKNT